MPSCTPAPKNSPSGCPCRGKPPTGSAAPAGTLTPRSGPRHAALIQLHQSAATGSAQLSPPGTPAPSSCPPLQAASPPPRGQQTPGAPLPAPPPRALGPTGSTVPYSHPLCSFPSALTARIRVPQGSSPRCWDVPYPTASHPHAPSHEHFPNPRPLQLLPVPQPLPLAPSTPYPLPQSHIPNPGVLQPHKARLMLSSPTPPAPGC